MSLGLSSTELHNLFEQTWRDDYEKRLNGLEPHSICDAYRITHNIPETVANALTEETLKMIAKTEAIKTVVDANNARIEEQLKAKGIVL